MRELLDTLLNGPARYTEQHNFGPGLTLAIVLGALLAEFVAAYVLFKAIVKLVQNLPVIIGFVLRKCGVGKKDDPFVFLELTFPADTTKSAYATEQLHILLRTPIKHQSTLEKLAGQKNLHSLELVSTHDDGIGYVMAVPSHEVDYVERSLRSYLPGLKIKKVKDYLNGVVGIPAGVVELKLSSDFVLPLQDHTSLEQHDPMAFLTGHMTKLIPKELIASQLILTPVLNTTHRRAIRHMQHMRLRIKQGKTLSSELKIQRTPQGYAFMLLWYPPLWFINAMMKVVSFFFDILNAMFAKDHPMPEILNGNKDKKRAADPYETELSKAVKTKLDQHLFEATMRILVASPDPEVIERRLEAIVDSFRSFTTTNQALRLYKSVDIPVITPADRHLDRFKARTLSPTLVRQPTILSGSELSDLYHFPNTDLTKTEGLVKSRSRELPTPLSIKHSNANLDVLVGVNKHGGDEQPIGMTLKQRQKHTYIIGKTGTGKTTLLTNAIYQDMLSGKGFAVLDPHGDMFQELLKIIPEDRKKDVIVFDPSDRDYPLGLNLLEPGIPFANEDDKQEWITSSVLSVFAKLANEHQWGPRMEHVLRSTTMTALQVPNPSLYTLQRLLTDKKYQKEVAKTLKDPVLKQFWDKEFKLLGTMQLSSATAPLTHRLGHFLTTKMSRHILLQPKSTLRIADIMNESKILLVNLSKGDIGEDQSFFFGTILTSFIWMAAYQRTKIPEMERKDFFVYIDEFQNFATRQFADITSEGRKFHVSLVVSHQNVAQIEDQSVLKIMLGNAATHICLRASPDDEAFILPYMKPEVEKGDIVNLAPYHFYMKVTGDVSEDAFSGQTKVIDAEGSAKTKDDVVAHSRKQYGTPKAKVEKYMDKLFAAEQPAKKKNKATDTPAKNSDKTDQDDAPRLQGT